LSNSLSQHAQKVNEVLLFLLGELDIESPIVEIDRLTQVRGRSVCKIRRPWSHPAPLRYHNRAHVITFSPDQIAPRIVGVDDAAQKRMGSDGVVACQLE